MKRFWWYKLVIVLAVVTSGVLAGWVIPPTNRAHGEVRGTVEQPQFQSASVPLLREIAGTLRQIDSRLARLEATVQKMQVTTAAKAARDSGK